jgi:predicted PurR-regulated permease PerM
MRERIPSHDRLAAARERAPNRVTIELSWRSWWKLAGVVAAGWLWLRLWELVLVLIVAALLAVALDPVVAWLERRRVSRGLDTAMLLLAIVGCIAGLLALGWSSLSSQGALLAEKMQSAWQDANARLPCWGSWPEASRAEAAPRSRARGCTPFAP